MNERTTRPSPVDRFVDACRRYPLAVDAALAVIVALFGVALARSPYSPHADWDVNTVLAIVGSLPVVFRRRFPFPSAVVMAVYAAVVVATLGGVGIELPVLVMAYSVVVYGPHWSGPLMAAVMVLGGVLPIVVRAGVAQAGVLLFVVVFVVPVAASVWLAGALRRAQRRSVVQLQERARLLEQGRRQEVRLELLAERSRISREVHDVVAHSLSGIIAQADGGQFAAARDPERAVQVLAGIATAGREALADVRGLLVMLRDTAPVDDSEDPSRPQPGASDIAALVEQVRAGGMPVTLDTSGASRELTTGAGLAAYRVVQEGLTNVVKHAGPATPTRVTLDWGRDELTVGIRDDGPRGMPPAPPRGGHGLIGMRERAALHGGTVETGPHPDGGFAVRMRLPYTPAAARGA